MKKIKNMEMKKKIINMNKYYDCKENQNPNSIIYHGKNYLAKEKEKGNSSDKANNIKIIKSYKENEDFVIEDDIYKPEPKNNNKQR